MKIFGAALCLGIVVGVAAAVGVHSYFNTLSFIVPSGEIIFFLVTKK